MNEIIKTNSHVWTAFVLLLFVFSSCSTTKFLKERETLHKRTKVRFDTPEAFVDKATFKREIISLSRPKPNNKINLRFYNLMGTPRKEKGLWHWLGNKFGEPPVLYDKNNTANSRIRMQRYLKNHGHFNASVEIDTIRENKEMEVIYHITSKCAHSINSYQLVIDSSRVIQLFLKNMAGSHIKVGQSYRLSDLSSERTRLTSLAQNNGYLHFAEDNISFLVDTTAGECLLDLHLFFVDKENSDETFRLGKTYVYTNYNLRSINDAEEEMISRPGGMYYPKENNVVEEEVIDQLMPLKSGALYSKSLQDVTFNRLQAIGIFKFINIKYEQDSTLSNMVNRHIYLTPGYMQDISGTLELNNQPGNYYGTTAGLTFTNKNMFGGAERFNLSLTGGLATQLNSGTSFINTTQVDLKMGISIPKLILPIKTFDSFDSFIPRTIISTGLGFESRIQFYTVQTAELKFGYRWRKSNKEQHEFFPLTFQMFNLINSSVEFDEYKSQSLRLSQSFDNTLLSGLKYTYSYSNSISANQKHALFFSGELETSGNLLYLFSRLGQNNGDEPFKLFGLPVAQFFKVSADLRHYRKFRNTTLVSRIFTGLGLAYGNLEELPYNRQFVIGGANSLRAFQLRELGPGSFISDNIGNQSIDEQFLDQIGNLKLELNIEFRYPIFRYLKGAVFLDAGNIWLVDNRETPEGNFKLGKFVEEIALGTGLGLRLDFNYFVIRLDTSFPLRQPFEEIGFRWVINDIDILNQQWRKDNLRWHLAIGYPF